MTRPEVATARKLRANLTPTERILWSRLRRSALGYKFRRQYPIGPYVADFCCLPVRVVIEIDGGSHFADEAAIAYDVRRSRFIEEAGYRIVRVTTNEVRRELDGVCAAIRQACDEATMRKR